MFPKKEDINVRSANRKTTTFALEFESQLTGWRQPF